MVNKERNITAYQGDPPTAGYTSRRIAGGPLYNKADVRSVLQRGDEALITWTRKCTLDLQRLAFDIADVRALVSEALSLGKYRNSEWCQQHPNGPWAACDAYQVTRMEWVHAAHKDMRFDYYVKFGIGKTGKILLIVSCHEPQERGLS
ncbi:hypothetical protein [Castellaniella sp.]|uniref:hypothetical protein n=1 Tax=Castellaniella sp. TaxID=1955812 RepID=UPI002AFF2098|nr:hypothetical protein [Castellaniella sp.]